MDNKKEVQTAYWINRAPIHTTTGVSALTHHRNRLTNNAMVIITSPVSTTRHDEGNRPLMVRPAGRVRAVVLGTEVVDRQQLADHDGPAGHYRSADPLEDSTPADPRPDHALPVGRPAAATIVIEVSTRHQAHRRSSPLTHDVHGRGSTWGNADWRPSDAKPNTTTSPNHRDDSHKHPGHSADLGHHVMVPVARASTASPLGGLAERVDHVVLRPSEPVVVELGHPLLVGELQQATERVGHPAPAVVPHRTGDEIRVAVRHDVTPVETVVGTYYTGAEPLRERVFAAVR